MKIVLNPGHGPKNTGIFDPGAVGPTGIKEADINLSVANKLKPLLEAAGIEVLLIRDGDLSDITNQANASKADYFISLHCNSFSNGEAHGTETYVYQENSQAKDLALKLQDAAVKTLGTTNRGLKTNSFWVLRKTEMPALLIEMAFISNAKEERMLNDADIQNKLALALSDAIINHFGIKKESTIQIRFHLDEEENIDVNGQLIDNSTYFPIRKVFEELGYRVEWNEDRTVDIYKE